MKRVSVIVGVLFCLATLTLIVIAGCASIMKGSKETVSITSMPSQAKVSIETTGGVGVWTGETPATVKISKKKEYLVKIDLEGYQQGTAHITKDGVEGWFWGNLICGGILGIIIDASNGAMNKLEPNQIHVELIQASNDESNPAVYAVFYGLDDHNQLRQMIVPLIKESTFGQK